MQMTIEGSLVRLRPFASAAEYAQLNHELWMQRDDWWGYGWVGLSSLEQDWARFGMLDESHYFSFLAIESLAGKELVGYEVLRIPTGGRTATEIGTMILEPYWRRGYGREAKLLAMKLLFDNYPVEMVYGGTLAKHEAAIGGMLSCGMRELGRTRVNWYSRGEWTGIVYCGITRQEWMESSQ
ncbi:GNAT family N-acetyltransferase [bacterium]|nr:GNAT family N-acetyltransferase [bacterium]